MTTQTSTLPSALVSLALGDTVSEDFGPLTRTHFVRYAGAGGDFHPLHHDEKYAQAAGLPGVFGMGLLHAGILGVVLARWVGPENIATFAVRFTGQVWPDDVLTLSGTVTEVEDTASGRLAHLALAVTRDNGESAIAATATARVA